MNLDCWPIQPGFMLWVRLLRSFQSPTLATFIGSGKVEEIHLWIEELEVDIVIFDDELSPRHQRELEERFGDDVRVIDRTALILDIFAQHANTREGTLQVTLAQYEYRLPRLTRQWTHLVRQAGGSASARGWCWTSWPRRNPTRNRPPRNSPHYRIAEARARRCPCSSVSVIVLAADAQVCPLLRWLAIPMLVSLLC